MACGPRRGIVTQAAPKTPVVARPSAITPPPAAKVAALPPAAMAMPPAELEAFLVNFVVEQTGYPPEIVELDADLEADLGVDSIKKAQLFGELHEYFEITPSDNLTLDDFPTLRHVLNFLQASTAVASVPAIVPAAKPPSPTAVAISSPAAPEPPASGELETFLVNFVVEQTGYPPEIVELDADLEADLGVDSIKKAQLFGELREYFDIMPSESLTLDDFPTLRHVLNFLRASRGGAKRCRWWPTSARDAYGRRIVVPCGARHRGARVRRVRVVPGQLRGGANGLSARDRGVGRRFGGRLGRRQH